MPLDHDERGRLAAIRAAAALATLGLGAMAWVIALQQMNGMDVMGVTGRGAFVSFISLWVLMVAAMMLPGATPAVFKHARASESVPGLLLFVGSYLAVWVLIGVALYAASLSYSLHGSAAGAVAIAAGGYELTPLKQYFRRGCSDGPRSGAEFGFYCVGSNIGLMLMQLALGLMSLSGMAVVGVLMLAQQVLPARAAFDVPLALALVALGMLILVAPWSLPGFMPAM